MSDLKELKGWFEANYLDGEKLEDSRGRTTLGAGTCFDAVEEAISLQRQKDAGKVRNSRVAGPKSPFEHSLNNTFEAIARLIEEDK